MATVMARFSDAEWMIAGGDDYAPDPNRTADEIAESCQHHFACTLPSEVEPLVVGYLPTFGVMQPTGDRWGAKPPNYEATIDRIAGSPWMGREFCRRMYHGGGPLYNGYYHNFADEELQCVAQKLGVYTIHDYTDILNHLITVWDVRNLALSGEAAEAQEVLCKQAERLASMADLVTRKIARQPRNKFSWIYNRTA